MLITSTVAIAVLAVAQTLSQPLPQDALSLAVGVWELDPAETDDRGDFTCSGEPLIVSIDRKNMRYRSTAGEYEDVADILDSRFSSFRIQYDNEERLDDAGNPVIWTMVFPDDDHFYWVREDWKQDPSRRTNMRRRCKSPPLTS